MGNFLLGDPNQATVGTIGRGNIDGITNWAQFYLEDSWKITHSFNLDIGLRYEYNQNMKDANNDIAVINTLVPGGEYVIASSAQGQISPAASALLADIPIPHITSAQAGWDPSLLQSRPLRLAPRIGISWSLPDNKTVIRAGFGIYTNQAAYNIIETAALNLPFYFAETVTNNGTLCSGAACNTEKILSSPPNGSISGNSLNHNYKIEYNNVWNLSIERSLSSTTSIQAQYIGSYTVHGDNYTEQNLFPDACLNLASGCHARPIPSMSAFSSVTWDGWAKYDALAITLSQHLWRGLLVNSSYTWSKALDDASNPGADNAEDELPAGSVQSGSRKGSVGFRPQKSFRHQLSL